jgi:hypothetical protein
LSIFYPLHIIYFQSSFKANTKTNNFTICFIVSFWVIPRRLNFMCRRFGTPSMFHLHRRCNSSCLHRLRRWNRQSVPKRLQIQFRCGDHPTERIQYSKHSEGSK